MCDRVIHLVIRRFLHLANVGIVLGKDWKAFFFCFRGKYSITKAKVFQRYVVCLRRDAMIEIAEACVHYLFITIVTACFLPLGGIDYICYVRMFCIGSERLRCLFVIPRNKSNIYVLGSQLLLSHCPYLKDKNADYIASLFTLRWSCVLRLTWFCTPHQQPLQIWSMRIICVIMQAV